MKILMCGDLHLTDKRPASRIDDYRASVLRKFEFLLSTAANERCSCIVQPADFFDSPAPSYSFFAEIHQMISEYEVPILTAYGQHDLRYRNAENTGLFALFHTNPLVTLLGKTKVNNIHFYGASFGQDIPDPENPQHLNVLVTHRMVVLEKLWADQTSFVYGSDLLKKHPHYQMIITGDNHKNFVVQDDDRILINAGSMMRSTIDQYGHTPVCYVAEQEGPEFVNIEEIAIPIEPSGTVFDMEKTERIKEQDANIMAYIQGLQSHKSTDLQFEDDLEQYLKENQVDEEIIKILQTAKGDE